MKLITVSDILQTSSLLLLVSSGHVTYILAFIGFQRNADGRCSVAASIWCWLNCTEALSSSPSQRHFPLQESMTGFPTALSQLFPERTLIECMFYSSFCLLQIEMIAYPRTRLRSGRSLRGDDGGRRARSATVCSCFDLRVSAIVSIVKMSLIMSMISIVAENVYDMYRH